MQYLTHGVILCRGPGKDKLKDIGIPNPDTEGDNHKDHDPSRVYRVEGVLIRIMALNPKPQTLNPKPEYLNLEP